MELGTLSVLSTAIAVLVVCSVLEFLAALRFNASAFALGPILLREQIPLAGAWPLHFAEARGETSRVKYEIQDDRRILFRDKVQFLQFQFQTPLTYKATLTPTQGGLDLEVRAPLANVLLLAGFVGFAAVFASLFAFAIPQSALIITVLIGLLCVGFVTERRRARNGANEVVSDLLRRSRAA